MRTDQYPRHRARDDAAFSLIELIVAMAVFTVMLSIVGTVIVTLLKAERRTEDRSNSQNQVRLALASIDRQVRSGNVLYDPAAEADPNKRLRIYTQSNGAENCVEWQLVVDPATTSRYLLQTRSWAPGSTLSARWRTIASNLVVAPSDKPFQVPGPSRLVWITLKARGTFSDSVNVTVSSKITGRNTEYGYNFTACSSEPSAT